MPSHYSGDPYWLTAKYGKCAKCGIPVKGKRAFYYPKGKHVYCEACGEIESARFNAEIEDEDSYNYRDDLAFFS
jgi:hypothetical protein